MREERHGLTERRERQWPAGKKRSMAPSVESSSGRAFFRKNGDGTPRFPFPSTRRLDDARGGGAKLFKWSAMEMFCGSEKDTALGEEKQVEEMGGSCSVGGRRRWRGRFLEEGERKDGSWQGHVRVGALHLPSLPSPFFRDSKGEQVGDAARLTGLEGDGGLGKRRWAGWRWAWPACPSGCVSISFDLSIFL